MISATRRAEKENRGGRVAITLQGGAMERTWSELQFVKTFISVENDFEKKKHDYRTLISPILDRLAMAAAVSYSYPFE